MRSGKPLRPTSTFQSRNAPQELSTHCATACRTAHTGKRFIVAGLGSPLFLQRGPDREARSDPVCGLAGCDPVSAYTSKGSPCEIHSPHRRICCTRRRRFRCCHVCPDQVRSGFRRQQPDRPDRPQRRVATERLIPAVKDRRRRPRRSRASCHCVPRHHRHCWQAVPNSCQSVSNPSSHAGLLHGKNVCISPPQSAPQRQRTRLKGPSPSTWDGIAYPIHQWIDLARGNHLRC